MKIGLPDNPYLGCLYYSIIVYALIFFVGYLFEIFGFLVLIPLALAYCAFYVHKNIEERKKKLELQKALYRAKYNELYHKVNESYGHIIALFTLKLNEKYTFMHFDNSRYQDQIDLNQKFKSIFDIHEFKKSEREYCRMILSDFLMYAVRIFKSGKEFVQPDISRTEEIKWQYADSTYLKKEKENNCTKDGKNPSDWSIRRSLVWRRDQMKCQCCGMYLNLEECHIHHIQRRSDGGTHELTNLVTLCKDCHTKMPGHEKMKAYTSYYVGRKIHTPNCRYAKRASRVIATYSNLRKKGIEPCKICCPWERNEWKISNYRMQFEDDIENILEDVILAHFLQNKDSNKNNI
jgi:hypothetical protein